MTPPDLADLGAHLRAHATILRDVRDESLAGLHPEAIEVLTVQALDLDRVADRLDAAHAASLGAAAAERQAEAVRLALLRHRDAAPGVLRLMTRPAPVPVVPRPMARVLPFRRGAAPILVHVIGQDVPGGPA